MLSAEEKQLILTFFSYFGLTESQLELGEDGETVMITLKVDPSDTGRFIGRFATTLDSLQLLVSMMLNNGKELRHHVVIDVGGYRAERLTSLENMAAQASAEVESTGVPHSLPPLSASDRRQIHLLFKDHATLTTYSQGDGQNRRLVIAQKPA